MGQIPVQIVPHMCDGMFPISSAHHVELFRTFLKQEWHHDTHRLAVVAEVSIQIEATLVPLNLARQPSCFKAFLCFPTAVPSQPC